VSVRYINPAALIDEAAGLLDSAHVDAVAALLVDAGAWASVDEAREAVSDVLAASHVVAAERDEED
jgi:hypothetical protein